MPEPEALDALQAAAAAAYGVDDPAMVVAAPGTQILISLLPYLLACRDVRVLGPTYGEHAQAWRNAGVAVTEVGDLAALAGGDCAVVCNPNNPDGRVIAASALAGCRLSIVDEAFADVTPAVGMAPRDGVLVLRSFGKFYGLAGLRLGFLLAERGMAARVRSALGPWAVSGPALAIGTRALRDADWRAATRARLERDARRLDEVLTGAGLRLVGGTSLFRLVEGDAAAIAEDLARAGILVRRFASHPRWLRFGLPADAAGFERLNRALVTNGNVRV